MMPKKSQSRKTTIFVLASFLFSLFLPFLSRNNVLATDYDLSSSSNYDVRIAGAAASDNVGAMKVGDVNGDGIDDLVMGARGADNNGTNSGSVWVIFGGSTKSGDQLLSTSGDYNIRFSGQAGEYLGSDIAIGDVNGDGHGDLILGAYVASNNGNASSGSVYVIFSTLIDDVGNTTGNNLDFSTSSNYNIRYDGAATDGTGYLGDQDTLLVNDVNGDDKNDLIMNANHEDNNGSDSGSVYIIFSTLVDDVGSTTGNNKILSTSGNYNVRFDGASAGEPLYSLKAGDVNGDGYGDLVLGSYLADSYGGSAWVILSTLIDDVGSSTGQNKALSDSSNYNIRLDGTDTSELTYQQDIAIGDVNGDGYSDLILGGPYADPSVGQVGTYNGGSVWVIFSTLVDTLASSPGSDLSLATGDNFNVRFDGHGGYNYSTSSQSYLTEGGNILVGDVNGDGNGDLILGASNYSITSGSARGDAFAIYSTLIDDVGSTTGNVKPLLAGYPTSYNIDYYGGNSSTHLTYKGSMAIGDVDNDGNGDLLLGTYTGIGNKGYLWVMYSSRIQQITGTGNQKKIDDSNNYDDEYIGAESSAFLTLNGTIKISDLNNDGGKDLILGSRGVDANGADSGAVYLFYGTPSNTAPSDPSSLGGHTNGSFINDNTPALTFTLSDPDVGDTVKYQIQIDDNSDFSSPVVDYTSALGSQGSKTFTVGQAAGSGSYTTGSEGQTLTDNSYYWQVKAIDASAAESSFVQANSGSVAFQVDATEPSAPSFLSITSPTTDNTPPLTWSASSDSGSGLATTPYTVEWCTDSSFTGCGSNTDTTSVTAFTNSTALADGTWYFRVKADDAAGNSSSYSSNVSVIIDTTDPASIFLDSPGGSEYTNNERPTFKWRATTDSGGLSKYTLSINNGDTGSFTIDNIGTTGTSVVETNRYVINYDGFGDGDSTNNYISVYTKSHSDWSSSQNDGKLYQGKRSWSVTAYDSSGNSTSASRTLNVDLNSPSLSLIEVTGSTSKFSVSGILSDTKAGSNSSESDYIRSDPDIVEVSIKKNGVLTNEVIATAKINLSSICDYSDTTSDTLSCAFSKDLESDFGTGTFTLEIKGIDKAGNSTTSEENISVGVLSPGPTPILVNTPVPSASPAVDSMSSPSSDEYQKDLSLVFSDVIQNSKDKIVEIYNNVFEGVKNVTSVVVTNIKVVTTNIITAPGKIVFAIREFFNTPKLVLGASTQRVSNRFWFIWAAIFPGQSTQIENVKVLNITADGATIYWETNQPSTSRVNYGEDTKMENSKQNELPVRRHEITLNNLPSNKQIYFEVISQGRTTAYDSFRIFTTKQK